MIAQIALSMMLLVAAGLVVQTIERLENQDLGFRVDHLMRGHLYLPPAQYPTADTITRFCDQLTERNAGAAGRARGIRHDGLPTDGRSHDVFYRWAAGLSAGG